MTDGTLLTDFRTEYAKSAGAKCSVCEKKIAKVIINCWVPSNDTSNFADLHCRIAAFMLQIFTTKKNRKA